MNKLWKRLAFLPAVLFCISTVVGQGVPAPYTVRLQPFASGLDRPILFRDDGPGSGRKKFIVQQTGLIRLLQPGSRTSTDFINLAARIPILGGLGECGPRGKEHEIDNKQSRDRDGASVAAARAAPGPMEEMNVTHDR